METIALMAMLMTMPNRIISVTTYRGRIQRVVAIANTSTEEPSHSRLWSLIRTIKSSEREILKIMYEPNLKMGQHADLAGTAVYSNSK